jgi:RNA polymerase sigma factor (sigma-70 family)
MDEALHENGAAFAKGTETANPKGRSDFRTTHWSVVVAAGWDQSAQGTAALETLCRAYWFPLYCFVRRKGYDAHTAQDLTQTFFEKLLEKEYLRQVQAGRGRFRNFLLAALNHFLANEWDRLQAKKRGGGHQFISFEEVAVEERYSLEPVEAVTPERLFEQRWAEALLERVLARLGDEYGNSGKPERFAALKLFLIEDGPENSQAEIAQQLNMSISAVKSAVHRLRQRYGELLREEIGQTVAFSDEIDGELRHLFQALG